MALPPLRTLRAPSMNTLLALENAWSSLRISQPTISRMTRRNASHQAQGRANKAKDGAGKRLGAKKTGGEYVIPGNILFKQRGTHWFPGDNCHMGRDHTIHASLPGYVRYYRDPLRHPKRKYIGIVFEKDQSLPQAPTEPRRRKLGMLAYEMPTTTTELTAADLIFTETPKIIAEAPRETRHAANKSNKKAQEEEPKLTLRSGYQYRQANWEIGRLQDKKEAEAQSRGRTTRLYPDFVPGDRFAAWRKRNVRIQASMERRSRGRKGAKKAKN